MAPHKATPPELKCNECHLRVFVAVYIRTTNLPTRTYPRRYEQWLASLIHGARVAQGTGEVEQVPTGDVVAFYREQRRVSRVPTDRPTGRRTTLDR